MATDIRQNAATMPAADFEKFLKACVLLKSTIVPGTNFSVYDQWVAIHGSIMGVRTPGSSDVRQPRPPEHRVPAVAPGVPAPFRAGAAGGRPRRDDSLLVVGDDARAVDAVLQRADPSHFFHIVNGEREMAACLRARSQRILPRGGRPASAGASTRHCRSGPRRR